MLSELKAAMKACTLPCRSCESDDYGHLPACPAVDAWQHLMATQARFLIAIAEAAQDYYEDADEHRCDAGMCMCSNNRLGQALAAFDSRGK